MSWCSFSKKKKTIAGGKGYICSGVDSTDIEFFDEFYVNDVY